jgi:hypothetical protein
MFADEVIPFSRLVDLGGWGKWGEGVCTCYKKEGFVVSLGVFSFKFSTMDSVEQRESIIPLFNESCHP